MNGSFQTSGGLNRDLKIALVITVIMRDHIRSSQKLYQLQREPKVSRCPFNSVGWDFRCWHVSKSGAMDFSAVCWASDSCWESFQSRRWKVALRLSLCLEHCGLRVCRWSLYVLNACFAEASRLSFVCSFASPLEQFKLKQAHLESAC